MNKFIEKWMTFVSVLHFFTRVNSECSRFNIVCVRADKNPELSKTFKMKLLEKIVKIFENTNYFYNNIYLRACLHVNIIPVSNHACLWWNVSYCLHVPAGIKFHPGMKDRDEISSPDEILKWACFLLIFDVCI